LKKDEIIKCILCGEEYLVRKEDSICLNCIIHGLEKRIKDLEDKSK